MTTTTTPISVTLTAGELACEACGVAVPGPHRKADVTEYEAHWADRPKLGVRSIGKTGADARRTPMTRCAACLATRERADALLDAHPRVRAAIGSRSMALHQVESALSAIDALGQTAPTIRNDRALRLLIEHLTAPGAGVQWSSRFAPMLMAGAANTAAASRWSHLTDEQRRALHVGFAQMLRARTEHPRAYAPPTDGPRGCLLCGIGSVTVLPSQEYEAWHPLAVSPFSIGGQRGTERIEGYVCSTCDRALSAAGSIGPSAMEQSLRLHFGVVQRGLTTAELDGLVGWGALRGAEPNSRPWSHIEDVETVARALGS